VVTAFAPGRVNLIGDHTDYTGGWVLPVAVQLGTTVTLSLGGTRLRLESKDDPEPADVPLDVSDPAGIQPPWARYLAGVVAELQPATGGTGEVHTTLPIGGGLSSSAALELAVALALGFDGPPIELARACQRAEHRASHVPCGIMDQLTSAAGVAGCALLINCRSETFEPVPIPENVEIVAIHSGEQRQLAASEYATRRTQCEQAFQQDDIEDPLLRRRARHVITENDRVLAAADALRHADLMAVGELMYESHRSLRDDFEVSTPTLDRMVEDLRAAPGVYGARLTGAGFGGCVVALAEPGSLNAHVALAEPRSLNAHVALGEPGSTNAGPPAWVLTPSGGARLLD
jgi:galactokinase